METGTFYDVSLEWECKTFFVSDEVMKMNYTTYDLLNVNDNHSYKHEATKIF